MKNLLIALFLVFTTFQTSFADVTEQALEKKIAEEFTTMAKIQLSYPEGKIPVAAMAKIYAHVMVLKSLLSMSNMQIEGNDLSDLNQMLDQIINEAESAFSKLESTVEMLQEDQKKY